MGYRELLRSVSVLAKNMCWKPRANRGWHFVGAPRQEVFQESLAKNVEATSTLLERLRTIL